MKFFCISNRITTNIVMKNNILVNVLVELEKYLDLADKSEYYYLKDNAREIRKRMEYEKLDLKYIESQAWTICNIINIRIGL